MSTHFTSLTDLLIKVKLTLHKTFNFGLYYIHGFIFILFIDFCLNDGEPLWEPVEWSLVQPCIIFIFTLYLIPHTLTLNKGLNLLYSVFCKNLRKPSGNRNQISYRETRQFFIVIFFFFPGYYLMFFDHFINVFVPLIIHGPAPAEACFNRGCLFCVKNVCCCLNRQNSSNMNLVESAQVREEFFAKTENPNTHKDDCSPKNNSYQIESHGSGPNLPVLDNIVGPVPDLVKKDPNPSSVLVSNNTQNLVLNHEHTADLDKVGSTSIISGTQDIKVFGGTVEQPDGIKKVDNPAKELSGFGIIKNGNNTSGIGPDLNTSNKLIP